MTKLKLTGWIIVLFVASVPAGFLTTLIKNPLTPREEYPIFMAIGTFAAIVVLGGLATGVYFLLRKSFPEVALKRAFQVYLFFCLCMIARASFLFPEAMKKRDRYEFLQSYDLSIPAWIKRKVDTELNKMSLDLPKEKKQEICDCAYYMMEYEAELMDRFMQAPSLEVFIQKDSEFNELVHSCIRVETDTAIE